MNKRMSFICQLKTAVEPSCAMPTQQSSLHSSTIKKAVLQPIKAIKSSLASVQAPSISTYIKHFRNRFSKNFRKKPPRSHSFIGPSIGPSIGPCIQDPISSYNKFRHMSILHQSYPDFGWPSITKLYDYPSPHNRKIAKHFRHRIHYLFYKDHTRNYWPAYLHIYRFQKDEYPYK